MKGVGEALEPCKKCRIHEPISTLNDGVCQECVNEQVLNDSHQTRSQLKNPYLVLGFVEFSILATLMFVFFPWSLLFCLIFYGLENTKFIVLALLHDFVKTILAVLAILVPLVVVFIIMFVSVYA